MFDSAANPSAAPAASAGGTPGPRLAFAAFVVVLAAHLWAVTVGLGHTNFAGNEFRQVQTAMSALFIQRDHDFALAYPTPILGKGAATQLGHPWSIPMEFPLYQWATVGWSDATGRPLTESGRVVSIACFYLALPAVWLLLRRLGLPAAARWLALALVLASPLHVFYARSVLIETMALMFSAWFLAAFLAALRGGRWPWGLVAGLAGAAAGAVKVTTFMVWLVPAVAWGVAELRSRTRAAPAGGKLRAFAAVALRGAGLVAVPFAATVAWTRFADAVKLEHAGGAFLASGSMSQFNFGYGLFDLRFSAGAWQTMAGIWHAHVMPWPAVVAVTAGALGFGGRWRGPALAGVGLFFFAQFVFPLLYAWHDYYFVANTTFLLLGAGFALAGLAERRRGWWFAAPAFAALVAGQAHAYVTGYYPFQAPHFRATTDLDLVVRTATERDDVLVIAGMDWNARLPFYAQRRALMIRRALEREWPLIERSFANLGDETVGALVLCGDQRENRELLLRAVRELGIDPRPAFQYADADLFLSRKRLPPGATPLDPATVTLEQLGRLPPLVPAIKDLREQIVDVARIAPFQRRIFAMMQPEPERVFATFGAMSIGESTPPLYNAHPTTRLWFRVPAGPAPRLRLVFGIFASAYENPDRRTDGIEVVITRHPAAAGAPPRELLRRVCDPAKNPADRGDQTVALEQIGAQGDTIEVAFLPGPAGSLSWDWAYLRELRID